MDRTVQPLQRSVYLRSWSRLTPSDAPCQPPLSTDELPPREVCLLPAAGWIDPLPRPTQKGPRLARFGRLDRLAQLALLAASQAVERAGGGSELRDAKPAGGVALGTHYGSHLSNELFWRGARGSAGASPALFAYTLPSAAAAEISMHFGLTGPSLTFSGAEDSGLTAVAAAATCVATTAASRMLIVAADVLSPSLLAARVAETGELQEAAACILLDSDADAALARLIGVGHAAGAGALDRSVAAALEQAGLHRGDLRAVIGPKGTASYSEPCGLAAAPLIAGLAALQDGKLPLVLAAGGETGATALCWAQTP